MKIQSAKAGIGTGRAGLQAASGLFSNAGLFQKGVKSFHPNDLDPYLLFDAETSMLGTLEAETLDLDPANLSSLDVITATRSGVATRTLPNGTIALAPSDTVRVDYVDGVPMILIEPSATNLVEYSEDFDGSYWSANNLTITPNADLLGTANVSLLQESTYTSALPKIQLASGFGNTSGEHTLSFYVKNNNNTRYLGFSFGSSSERIRDTFDLQTETFKGNLVSGTTTGSVSFDRLGDYYRINVTATFPSPVTVQAAIAPLSTNTYLFYSLQDSGNRSFYLWGAQLETGSVATSYIPTSGGDAAARTRAADDLVISGSAFSDFYNASEGTFYVESVPNENTSGSFLFDLSFGNASTERLAIYNSGSNQKIFLKSSGTTWSDNIIGNRPAGGVLSRAAISFKTNNIEASIDGANMTPDTSATMSTTINKMTIGNRYENPNYLNGRIRRLIFWPTHSDSL